MNIQDLLNEVEDKKDDIIKPNDAEREVIFKLTNGTIVNTPKVFSATKAIKYYKIEKKGKILTLKIGDKTDNLKTVFEYNQTLQAIIITVSDAIFGSAIAAKAMARLIGALVAQPELELDMSDDKEIITAIKVSGTKISIKHKGKTVKLAIGSVYNLFVKSKATRPFKKMIKDDISPIIDAFDVEVIEDKDGDAEHRLGAGFKIEKDDEIENILYNLFQDAEDAEDVYNWISDLPMGDTITDNEGENGFVVSDINDVLDKEYDSFMGFDKKD